MEEEEELEGVGRLCCGESGGRRAEIDCERRIGRRKVNIGWGGGRG